MNFLLTPPHVSPRLSVEYRRENDLAAGFRVYDVCNSPFFFGGSLVDADNPFLAAPWRTGKIHSACYKKEFEAESIGEIGIKKECAKIP